MNHKQNEGTPEDELNEELSGYHQHSHDISRMPSNDDYSHDRRSRDKDMPGGGRHGSMRGSSLPPSSSTVHYDDDEDRMSSNDDSHHRRSRDKYICGGGRHGSKRGSSLPPSSSTVHYDDDEDRMSYNDDSHHRRFCNK